MISESKIFNTIRIIFDHSITGFKFEKDVYRITQKENFLSVLMKANGECDIIRRSLMVFLEKKRGKFPRLFFLSNEELIDIFGKGNNLVRCMIAGENEAFISTMFEGVHRLEFNTEQEITHMRSKDGEQV